MSRYNQFSPKVRRSRKLSCKYRGGVAREVSRRERHFPNTFTPNLSFPTPVAILLLERDKLNTKNFETGKFARKSFASTLRKMVVNFIWPPPLIIFLQPHQKHIHFHLGLSYAP